MNAARPLLFTRVVVEEAGRFVVLYEERATGCEWNFPGGKIGMSERPVEAAARELCEELCIEARDLTPVHEGHFVYRGTPWYGHYFHTRSWTGEIRIGEPRKTRELARLTPTEMALRGLPRHFVLDPLEAILARLAHD